jgi:hypothetical protein
MAFGGVLVARELAIGVISEIEAERPANAMRLARHLWEQELELAYVRASPRLRIRQMFRREAVTRLDLERFNRGVRIEKSHKAELVRLRKDARDLDAACEARRKAGEKVPASDWGLPPSRREMARAIERDDDFNLYWRGSSWYSHPGLTASDLHLEADEHGRTRVRRDGRSDPELGPQAAALALGTLGGLIIGANYSLGPLPGLQTAVDSLDARISTRRRPSNADRRKARPAKGS